ncbi:16S rRNA (cytosine(1402)-N(4))-methyltransferase RsmH [bacterium]|nr:16S rRNA (cytosine(1402)-N(4))-methyltransferase RsmH [bacterium]
MEHISVLLNESIESLNINPDGIYVDATLGGGGHSSEILKRLSSKGRLYSFDVDDYSIMRAKEKLESTGKTNYTIIKSNFENLKEELSNLGVFQIDGVLYDLGVSSFQFDMPEKGFSYNYDAKLDMRMDSSLTISAWNIVNEYSYKEIADILYKYGDEIYSREIAKKIVAEREIKPINTTFELVDVIKKALPNKELNKKGHPAKKSFQALRVKVNRELDVLESSLRQAIEITKPGGRIAVIDFEPLEDKIVKNVFKEGYTEITAKNLPVVLKEATLKRITKKPILPTDEEIKENRRSHSAMLRVVEKI